MRRSTRCKIESLNRQNSSDKNNLSNNWVKNFSSHDFTQSQINVLKKGTKFAIAPTKIPTLDFVCGVEQDLMQVDHKHKALINYTRAQVVNILKTAKPSKQNFSKICN